MAYVYRCDEGDFDSVANTCAAPFWSEDTGFLPPLSAADSMQIAAAIVGCWMVGHIVRQLRKTARENV